MAKKLTDKERIARAKKLGREGFKAGKQASCQDAELCNMTKGAKVGDPMARKIFNAWNEGWSAEHKKHTDKMLRQSGFYD